MTGSCRNGGTRVPAVIKKRQKKKKKEKKKNKRKKKKKKNEEESAREAQMRGRSGPRGTRSKPQGLCPK